MQYTKGFTWQLCPGIGLCELVLRPSAALVQYHASVANTPAEWTGLHAFRLWTGMLAPGG